MKLLYIALTVLVIGIIIQVSYDTVAEHFYSVDGLWM